MTHALGSDDMILRCKIQYLNLSTRTIAHVSYIAGSCMNGSFAFFSSGKSGTSSGLESFFAFFSLNEKKKSL